jgi:hypothetical protein
LQSDGANTIKDKIVEYIGGEMTDGTLTAGLGMGGTVNRSYIYSLVWSVEGIADVGVQIKNVADSDYSGGLTEITAAVTETPRANADKIEVIFV